MWFNCIYFYLLTTFMLLRPALLEFDSVSFHHWHLFTQICSCKQSNALFNCRDFFSPSFPHFFVVFSSSFSHVAPAGMQRECLVCRQRFWAFLILHRKQDRTWEGGLQLHSGLWEQSFYDPLQECPWFIWPCLFPIPSCPLSSRAHEFCPC